MFAVKLIHSVFVKQILLQNNNFTIDVKSMEQQLNLQQNGNNNFKSQSQRL